MILANFTIPGELVDLNTYIRIERGNKFKAAQLKKEMTDLVAWTIKENYGNQKVRTIFSLEIHWYVKDLRKDPDNISFAKKFILDGMQVSGMIDNDSMRHVKGFQDIFSVDKDNPRIEVQLYRPQILIN